MGTYLKGIAHYIPEKKLTNMDLEKMVDTTDEWIFSRTGIRQRAMASDEETTSYMATRASERALKAAGMEATEMDALILATTSPDMSFPGSSHKVQAGLKCGESLCFDMNSACCGFVYGVELVSALLETGKYKNIIFPCAEKLSKIVNYKDRSTCILFGDGAGAVVLSSEPGGPELVATYTSGNGNLSHLLQRPAGGTELPTFEHETYEDFFIQMGGKEVFKHAVRGMSESAEKILEITGWDKSEIDWLIPHQANIRLIKAAASRLDISLDKVVINIENLGNTSAATIPIAMSEAQAKFKPGDKIVCVAFGAGFTWGGLGFVWG